MAQDKGDVLELLKFELKFLEDGGYGRSPHIPRREPLMLEDSPSCLNFGEPDKPHPCSEMLDDGLRSPGAQEQERPMPVYSADGEGRNSR
jgi:hypothetical protein